jgi:cell division protein FtsI/penicillin-binding protein 2
VLIAFALLAARLVYLQVLRHDELATQAEANRIAVVPMVPNRGLIVDRNGVVLATNYSAYTLEISPRALRAGTAKPSWMRWSTAGRSGRDRPRDRAASSACAKSSRAPSRCPSAPG